MRVVGYRAAFDQYVRHLPLRTSDAAATGQVIEMFQHALNHPTFDNFWRAISTREQLSKMHVPVFAVGGWYDNFVESDLDAHAALDRLRPGVDRILVGPWAHNMSEKFAGIDYGPDAAVAVRALQLAWFDFWLKGKSSPLLSGPPVKVFVMGANRWREMRQWPPEDAHTVSLYLDSKGHANTLNGDGSLGPKPARRTAEDRYQYDPRNATPTAGGAVCCNPRVFPWGPMDQRRVEARGDVLVYSTKTLKRDVEVVGPVTLVLYASTTARDTDFTAKLVDVFPDGTARNLTDGILRLRYRDSLSKEELAEPGEIYRLTIDAGVTGNVFLKGHRIRLEVSSSNFPRFDRNPNTGGPIATETRASTAGQTIYHDPDHASQLLLQVIETPPGEKRSAQ
jgi:putative CocE/NonD family hydrolase